MVSPVWCGRRTSWLQPHQTSSGWTEPGLITQHQGPTSLMHMWLDGSKSLWPESKFSRTPETSQQPLLGVTFGSRHTSDHVEYYLVDLLVYFFLSVHVHVYLLLSGGCYVCVGSLLLNTLRFSSAFSFFFLEFWSSSRVHSVLPSPVLFLLIFGLAELNDRPDETWYPRQGSG